MPRPRWTLGKLMLLIAAVAATLGALRSELGEVFALIAGGVIGCGLAPWFASRGMRRLEADLERDRPELSSSERASIKAQAYLLILVAWMFAGVVVAAAAILLAGRLRP